MAKTADTGRTDTARLPVQEGLPAPRGAGVTRQLDTLPDVLTVAEAARVLRLGRNSAYEGVRSGTIPSVRIGRRLLVPKAGILRLLQGE